MKRRGLPKNVSEFQDRHGVWRTRFRKSGQPTYYFKAKVGTDEWREEYLSCKSGEIKKEIPKTQRVPSGSMAALIAIYYQSAEFQSLRPATKNTYRGILKRFCEQHGTKLVAKIERKHIIAILGKMQDRPSAANNLLDRLRGLMSLALDLEWIKHDPTIRVKSFKVKTGGFPDWSEEEVQQFEAYYPIGTKERLALDLLLYTGQRRSDVVRMGRQHIKNGAIRIVQQKTGVPLDLPIPAPLWRSIDLVDHGHLTFIVTSQGQPYTANGFGNWFRKIVRAAGIQDRSAHGLRKAATRRYAEAGTTNAEIKAITGHKTDKEVKRYMDSANQLKLANAANLKVYGNKE